MIYFLTKKVKIGICGLMNDFRPFSFIGAMSPFWKAGKKTIIVIIDTCDFFWCFNILLGIVRIYTYVCPQLNIWKKYQKIVYCAVYSKGTTDGLNGYLKKIKEGVLCSQHPIMQQG